MVDLPDVLKEWIKNNPVAENWDRPEHWQARAVHVLAMACGIELGSPHYMMLLATFVGRVWSKEDEQRAHVRARETSRVAQEQQAKREEQRFEEEKRIALENIDLALKMLDSQAPTIDPGKDRVH